MVVIIMNNYQKQAPLNTRTLNATNPHYPQTLDTIVNDMVVNYRTSIMSSENGC